MREGYLTQGEARISNNYFYTDRSRDVLSVNPERAACISPHADYPARRFAPDGLFLIVPQLISARTWHSNSTDLLKEARKLPWCKTDTLLERAASSRQRRPGHALHAPTLMSPSPPPAGLIPDCQLPFHHPMKVSTRIRTVWSWRACCPRLLFTLPNSPPLSLLPDY